jgi:predicted RNA-binding protein
MPRYWILSMTEDNYLITKEHCLIGMSKSVRRAIQQMSIGDMIIFYLSRKTIASSQRVQQYRGIARVSGEAFESDKVIWPARGREMFPHRRNVEFISDASTEARPLIEKLSFVTNTLLWAIPLQKGYVEITAKDFETIEEAMKSARENRH